MNHMSEPLYRIWDIRNKYYISNKDFFVNLNGNVGHLRSYQKDEYYIIQRCTGEQDVNGKYIYEGDIVETHPNVVSSIQAIVNFNTGNFVIEDLQGYEELTFEDTLTIIGNNLENPELLLGKD